jgi:hypothetical protein
MYVDTNYTQWYTKVTRNTNVSGGWTGTTTTLQTPTSGCIANAYKLLRLSSGVYSYYGRNNTVNGEGCYYGKLWNGSSWSAEEVILDYSTSGANPPFNGSYYVTDIETDGTNILWVGYTNAGYYPGIGLNSTYCERMRTTSWSSVAIINQDSYSYGQYGVRLAYCSYSSTYYMIMGGFDYSTVYIRSSTTSPSCWFTCSGSNVKNLGASASNMSGFGWKWFFINEKMVCLYMSGVNTAPSTYGLYVAYWSVPYSLFVQVTTASSNSVSVYWNNSAWVEQDFATTNPFIGYYSSAMYRCGMGLRFPSVVFDPTKHISFASLVINLAESAVWYQANARIYGERTLNPVTFTTNISDFTTRRGLINSYPYDNGAGVQVTTANTRWLGISNDSNNECTVLDTWISSPDISSVIAEIVSQTNWASGNSIVLYVDDFKNESSLQSAYAFRRIKTYGTSSTMAPVLYIEWLNIQHYIPDAFTVKLGALPNKHLNKNGTNLPDSSKAGKLNSGLSPSLRRKASYKRSTYNRDF